MQSIPSEDVEAGRYHLYVSLACPWAAGALSTVYLKGLEEAISLSIVHPTWAHTHPEIEGDTHAGWQFKAPGDEAVTNPNGLGSFDCDDALIPDTVSQQKSLREVYELAGDLEGP